MCFFLKNEMEDVWQWTATPGFPVFCFFYGKDKSVVTNDNTAEKYFFCEIEKILENPYSTRKSGRYLFYYLVLFYYLIRQSSNEMYLVYYCKNVICLLCLITMCLFFINT